MQNIDVSERAVFARVSRRLRREHGEVLRRSHWNSRNRFDLGEFYTVDPQYNCISGKDIDLEGLARSLGVLGENESMQS